MKKYYKSLLGLAIGLTIAFASCASAPSKFGQNLEETLGTSLVELERMLGTTQAEFENLLGRRLANDEADEDGYFIENYPKKGLSTFFRTDGNNIVNVISIGMFQGQNGFNTIVQQTTEVRGDPVVVTNNATLTQTYVWSSITEGIAISIRPPATSSGDVLWLIQKL